MAAADVLRFTAPKKGDYFRLAYRCLFLPRAGLPEMRLSREGREVDTLGLVVRTVMRASIRSAKR